MKLFYSAIKKNELLDTAIEMGARNFLLSFEDKKIDKQIEHLNQYSDLGLTILVDSGAFSAWNRGAIIDREEYCKFIDKAKSNCKNELLFVNLDVIPHTKGQGKPSHEQTVAACEKGLENYRFFKERGHLTIHTMHQHDPWEYMDIIKNECSEAEIIGISPANEEDTTSKKKWLKKVYYHLRDEIKTHLFGLTSQPVLELFPVYSADSTTWLNPGKYGELFDYRRTLRIQKPLLNRYNALFLDQTPQQFHASFKYFNNIERNITALWRKRGIEWK